MTEDAGGAAGAAMAVGGILAGTRIATGSGWRRVEMVQPGETVLTLDAGYQRVAGVRSFRFPARAAPLSVWPLIVPRGALDCREPFLLAPEQQVLIACGQSEAMFGDAVALIPALALEGWRGIRRIRPRGRAEAVTLSFASPQMVYASRAVLLACPAQAATAVRRAEPVPQRAGNAGAVTLTLEQARHLVACLMAEDLGSVLPAYCT